MEICVRVCVLVRVFVCVCACVVLCCWCVGVAGELWEGSAGGKILSLVNLNVEVVRFGQSVVVRELLVVNVWVAGVDE